MEEKHFRSVITHTVSGSSNEFITDVVVDPIDIHFYTLISVENKTSAMTFLRIGVDRFSDKIYFYEEKNTVAATVYWIHNTVTVFGTERLLVAIYGAVAGDIVSIVLQGHIRKRD